jgi:hypothetical protein
VHVFPPAIKVNKESFPITLIGYNSSQMMVLTELVGDRDIDELITRNFLEPFGSRFSSCEKFESGLFYL